jgi:hydrogenase-1 operon protein HyaF
MNSEALSGIKIRVEAGLEENVSDTGNLDSVLSEIKFALQQLLQQKTSHCIDLRAMPWSPGEEARLEKFLGLGEVSVELNALGKSTFNETRFSGIWIVSHYNQEAELIGKLIEITYMPEMIFSQYDDVKNSLKKIQEGLER